MSQAQFIFTMRKVSRFYPPDREVLKDITLAFYPGAKIGVIGPNGSGKSPLLSAIAGLPPPRSGRVQVLGASPAEVRPRLAYVLQSVAVAAHVPLTVREVVTMGRYPHVGALGRMGRGDRRAVDEAMERLEIADLAARQIHALSGGQRQRAFVAQGLAQEADVLLLDEPVTGLDAVSEQRILAIVHEEAEAGRTVVISTH
ncbi:MAG TPA: ATP-binding cassette domain-containing protein, partial [Acidimicrobiales bacterium]|nr:ATP-binding cassette domain-containing protein [Acidimicrobiales bacterium]